jgi:hypothetical protein
VCYTRQDWFLMTHARCTVARARGGVGPTRGITVIAAPGARAAAVMPGVRRTRGRCRGREEPGVRRFFQISSVKMPEMLEKFALRAPKRDFLPPTN